MNDLHWWSATDLAAAIRGHEVTARDALEHLVARVEQLDGPINAVVQWDLERARTAADAADAALAAGEALGPLHGVPMTIKDSFQTEGCITTSGAPELADHVPDHDAWPVARLRNAGAIPFAKTNLPIFAGDIQSYNEVYGTTNNPHDVTRTAGGSSGGSAAALAMGFTPLEVGSDIGGSIRVPAHYSGVMGHKPSYGIVPAHGQIPGMPGTLSQADLAVCGPMARTVADLELGLDVLAGPDRWNEPAWRLELPAADADDVSELRIAAWLDDEDCPVDASTRRVLGELVARIEAAGGRVDTSARPGFTLAKADRVFKHLLFAALAGGVPRATIEELAAASDDSPLGVMAGGTAARHRDWLADNERRLQIRERWREFFLDVDVILLPVQPRGAIPHDHSEPQWDRRVEIDGVERPYLDLFGWTGPAGAGMLPATVVPAGLGDDGLPIGVQIVGPYLHDRTTLRAADLISHLGGGCPRPALAV
ncbi:MAG: amidase [Ilumatobacter sp.]|uniref:amidase n=1 Tax=Ilumatobacter sp. TaxID=1967498 RepID=UPI00260DE3F0|nr:amidase [Ilumatobacter sp.]MDJ0767210.1 amidase [Ilumatobacter sp.]